VAGAGRERTTLSGQGIHYWNPDRLRGDFFLETPDVHRVFRFWVWVAFALAAARAAGVDRTHFDVASAGVGVAAVELGVRAAAWCSVLTAALFGWLMEHCQMAGEWVIGGVEAKGFAYVLVFLGLEAIVRNRWNRGLLWLGGASAVHVVVGGWARRGCGNRVAVVPSPSGRGPG